MKPAKPGGWNNPSSPARRKPSCASGSATRPRWAGQVPVGHPLFEPACLLRLKVLRHAFRGPVHRFFIDEFQRVMSVVALNPSDTTLRIACERLLDHTLEEPLVIRLLSLTALTLLEQQARRDGQSVELSRSIQARFDDSAGAQTTEEIADYVNGITDAQILLTPGRIIIGEGTLPESLRPLAGMRVVRFLAELITSPEGRADLAGSANLLHALCLTCKEIGDPSSDYSTAQSWIDYHGSMGASQEARNLGEHCLQMWPQAQTPFTEWRISQGWATLCEACLRSHHVVAALRYLCLSLLAHREPAPDVELLRRTYRRAARIFRDLRAIPFVDECVAAEASLLSRIGDPGGAVHDLEVFRFLVKFRFALGGSPEERLELLLRSEELLRAGVPSTLPPLISAQASILRLLPAERVPADLRAAFLKRTATLPEAMRRMLEVTAAGRPTREQLVQLITTLPDAEDYGYLASQIEPILPAVANALRLAVETGDPELFLLASGPFSQPVLGVQVKEARAPSPRRQSTSQLRSVPLEKLRAGVFEEDERYSFAAMAQVSMRGLQDCLLDGEAILVICGEPGDAPSMMVATRGQPVAIRPVSSWSAAAFSPLAAGLQGCPLLGGTQGLSARHRFAPAPGQRDPGPVQGTLAGTGGGS